VRLTEAGSILARHGSYVAAAMDAAHREVAALTSLQTGRVRLVCFPGAAASVVPPALADLRRHAPGIEVTFTQAEPAQALTDVREGRCDVVVAYDSLAPGRPARGRRGEPSEGLHRRHLLRDPGVLALAEHDPNSRRRRLHLGDLSEQAWVAGCPECRDQLVSSCAAAGFEPRIVAQTDDHLATLAFVAAGLGIALLSGPAGDAAARHGGVTVRSVGGVTARSVFAATTADLARLPAIAAVLDALQETASII
jgi:DNA-binding transcriptional LysR family regulator